MLLLMIKNVMAVLFVIGCNRYVVIKLRQIASTVRVDSAWATITLKTQPLGKTLVEESILLRWVNFHFRRSVKLCQANWQRYG